MSYIVLQVLPSKLNEMEDYYYDSLQDKLPQGAHFVAKVDKCVITGYHSGKVLFQGKNAELEAKRWEKLGHGKSAANMGNKLNKGNNQVNIHSYSPPKNVDELILLGSDETGTGDYFGPMTVVCAHLTKEQMETIASWGVRDSKAINDEVIRQLAPKLLSECTYSLLVLRNEKYNKLQQNGMNQGEMKAIMHHQAMENVMKKCREQNLHYEGILIDQFVQPSRFFEYLKQNNRNVQFDKPIYFATKGEDLHPAVAVASILARYSFITEMEKLEKEVGMPLPKGAGPIVDAAAKKIVEMKGKEELYRVTKWHFANTKKVLNEV